jgi:hypothetical protein
VWGYPITPLIFLTIEGWMMSNLLTNASTRIPSSSAWALRCSAS